VDSLPAQKQEIGNAWASRMVAGGHLVGYLMFFPFSIYPDLRRGFVNLTHVFFFLGDTQLKVICFLSSLGLWITTGITCYAVTERVLVKRGYLLRLLESRTDIVYNLENQARPYLFLCRYGILYSLYQFALNQSLQFNFSHG